METEKDRKDREDAARRKDDRSMTEKGLGNEDREREDARDERAREHDIARRQMPIHR